MPAFASRLLSARLTLEQRRQLHAWTDRMARLTPYVLILLLPGSILLLPLYAWWRQKRKRRRNLERSDIASV